MARDFSTDPRVFRLRPAPTEDWLVHELVVVARGSGRVDWDNYATLRAPLARGLVVRLRSSILGGNVDLATVRTNEDWLTAGATVEASTDLVVARLRFGEPPLLRAVGGEWLGLVARDDFSGLSSHAFSVTGVRLLRGESWRNAGGRR